MYCIPQALNSHTKPFPPCEGSLLGNVLQEFFNNNMFIFASFHKLIKTRYYLCASYLKYSWCIRTDRKIMHDKWMPYQRTQFKIFKLLNPLILADCHFQIIQWSNSSNPNKAVDKWIDLNYTTKKSNSK